LFLAPHIKQASAEEKMKRKQIFKKNFKFIQEHNKRAAKGEVTYTVDVNHLAFKDDSESDSLNGLSIVTDDEFKAAKAATKKVKAATSGSISIPAELNWATRGKVTSVKDQGSCGACWSFSSTSVMESMYAIKGDYNATEDMSEQQAIDCSYVPTTMAGNHGCNGGLPYYYYYYASQTKMTIEADYKYQAATQSCNSPLVATKAINKPPVCGVKSSNSEQEMLLMLQDAPVTIGMNVESSFKLYSGGIYTSTTCNSLRQSNGLVRPNHAMSVVGYGTDNGVNYWLVKNSWGTKWGLNGYAKVIRGVDMCGIERALTEQPVFCY